MAKRMDAKSFVHFFLLACVGSSAKIQDLDSSGARFPTKRPEQFGAEELYDGDELLAPTARYREMRITLIERRNQRLPIGSAHAILPRRRGPPRFSLGLLQNLKFDTIL